jgi:hypothetical protein
MSQEETPATPAQQRARIARLLAAEERLSDKVRRLRRSVILELVELGASLSILFAGASYFMTRNAVREEQIKARHYQAWQVLSAAQGKTGNGGRIEALQELHADGVPLIGVDAHGATLLAVRLPGAEMFQANLDSALLFAADLEGTLLSSASARGAVLISANLRGAMLDGAALNEADLMCADLTRADVGGADLTNAVLYQANLAGLRNWREISSLRGANLYAARNPPPGFVAWATDSMQAVVEETEAYDCEVQKHAFLANLGRVKR